MMSETFVWLIYHFWHLSLSSTLCLDSETDVLQQLDHVAHLEKTYLLPLCEMKKSAAQNSRDNRNTHVSIAAVALSRLFIYQRLINTLAYLLTYLVCNVSDVTLCGKPIDNRILNI